MLYISYLSTSLPCSIYIKEEEFVKKNLKCRFVNILILYIGFGLPIHIKGVSYTNDFIRSLYHNLSQLFKQYIKWRLWYQQYGSRELCNLGPEFVL